MKRLLTPAQLLETVRAFLKTRKGDGSLRGKTVLLPAALRGGYHAVHFKIPAGDDDAPQKRLSFKDFIKK